MSKINSNTEYKLDNNLFANRLNKKLFLNTNLSNSNIPNNNNSLTKIYNQTKTTEISIQTNIRPFNKIFTTSKNNNFKYSSLILSTTNNSFNNTLLNNYLTNNNKSYDKQKNIKLPILVKDYEILNILKKSQNNNNNNKNFINNYKTKKNNNFSNHIYINGRILGEKKPFNNIEKEYIINYVKNYAFRHKVQNLKKNVKIFGEKVDYNKNKIKKPKIPKPLLITKKPNDFMNLIQNKINY